MLSRSRDVVARVRQRWKAVLVVTAVVTAAQSLVTAPIAALLLRLFLSQSGKAAIGNFEIAKFLLSPWGLFAVLVLGTVILAGTYMQLVALLRVLRDPPATAGAALRHLLGGGHRVLRLGLFQVGAAIVVSAPLLLAARALVKGAWGDRDINGLLVLKPPEFGRGLAMAGVPLLALSIVLVYLALRWLFALPALLESSDLGPFGALRESARLTKGRHLRHLGALAQWAVLAALLGVAVDLLVGLPGAWLLGRIGPRLGVALPATALVLVVWLAATTCATWFSLAFYAGLVDRLRREALGLPPASALPAATAGRRSRLRAGFAAAAALVALAALGAWWLLRTQVLSEDVEITAHRMGGASAPENTVAALRRAIADGAEWAELDVQLTSDGALVVLHDFDLVRVGGPVKPVAESTLEEVKRIDVGKALGKGAFDGERIPTLDEVIAAAGTAIRLNIELKPPTPASVDPLTDAVLATVRKAGLVGRCRLCSQSYEAMRRAKAAEPTLSVGFIAGASLGDLSRLEIDFLMVGARLATGGFVREAHARGMQVHPWTINDPDDLAGLLDRGVDNVITDVPAAMRARLAELRGLTAPERLLLRARNFLAD